MRVQSETALAKIILNAGEYLGHQLRPRGKSPQASWDVEFFYLHGSLTSVSVGGSSSTAYEWHWEADILSEALKVMQEQGVWL